MNLFLFGHKFTSLKVQVEVERSFQKEAIATDDFLRIYTIAGLSPLAS
jgi:hypothetical protein